MSNAAINALMTMELRERDKWVIEHPDIWAIVLLQAEQFPAFALPDPVNPAAVCGIVPYGDGVAELWMVGSQRFKGRTALTVLRQGRSLIASFVQVYGLTRLIMSLRPDNAEARVWAKKLGFEFDRINPEGGILGNAIEVWKWSFNSGVTHG